MVRKLEPGEIPPKYLTERDRIDEFDWFMTHTWKPGIPITESVRKIFEDEALWDTKPEEIMSHCKVVHNNDDCPVGIVLDDEGDCWIWQGPFREDGLPGFTPKHRSKDQGYMTLARRVAWVTFRKGYRRGYIPANYWVVGTCGESNCINPTHSKLERHKGVGMRKPSPPKFIFVKEV